MKIVKVLCGLIVILLALGSVSLKAGETRFWRRCLPAGPFTPGFRLIETSDASRSFPSPRRGAASPAARPLRVYVWYPAQTDGRRAGCGSTITSAWPSRISARSILPVPLVKGLDPKALQGLRASLRRGRPRRRGRTRKIPASRFRAGPVLRVAARPLRPLRVPGLARLRRGHESPPRHALSPGQHQRRGPRDRGPGHGIREGHGRLAPLRRSGQARGHRLRSRGHGRTDHDDARPRHRCCS